MPMMPSIFVPIDCVSSDKSSETHMSLSLISFVPMTKAVGFNRENRWPSKRPETVETFENSWR